MTTTSPMILLDQAEDQFAETLGWVETCVSESYARDALAPYCADEDGALGFRPVGPAAREWLKPDESSDWDQWQPAQPDEDGAREFWKVVVA